MKRLLRITIFGLVLSVFTTLYLASPFVNQAWADSCWYGCTDGPQKNRSGCSVKFRGTVGDGSLGHYEYTCGDEKISCFYRYNCEEQELIDLVVPKAF